MLVLRRQVSSTLRALPIARALATTSGGPFPPPTSGTAAASSSSHHQRHLQQQQQQKRAAAPAPATAGAAPSANDEVVFNVTAKDFKQIVVDSPVPVILDCWAAWCGPCIQLGPVIEKLVKQHKGKIRLVKLDTDANPELSQQLQVKNLPTMFLVNAGRMVDQVVGFNGEQGVKDFVNKAVALSAGAGGAGGSKQHSDLEQAQVMLNQIMAALKMASANELPPPDEEQLNQMVEALKAIAGLKKPTFTEADTKQQRRLVEDSHETTRAVAYAGLLRCAVLAKQDSEALQGIIKAIAQTFPRTVQEHAEIKGAIALANLTSAASAASAGGAEAGGESEVDRLKALLDKNAGDSESRLQLARVYFAGGQYAEAIDQGLQLLRRDRAYKDGAARQLLIDIFNALGNSGDLVKDARRKMSSILLN